MTKFGYYTLKEQLTHRENVELLTNIDIALEKEKLRHNRCYIEEYEKREILHFLEERFDSAYSRLFGAVENYENDREGIVGKNKYRLRLEKID